jgi:tetratricopeptide (TPR) repeat protein
LIKDHLRGDVHGIFYSWMTFLPEELKDRDRLSEVLAFARGELEPDRAREMTDQLLRKTGEPSPRFRATLHFVCGDFEKAWKERPPTQLEIRDALADNRWSDALAGIDAFEAGTKYPLRERMRYDRALARAQLGIVAEEGEEDLLRSLLLSRDLFHYLAERSEMMPDDYEKLFAVQRRVVPSVHDMVLLQRHAEWLEASGRYREAVCYRAALLKVKDTPKNVWAEATLTQLCQLHETLARAAMAEGDLTEAARRVEICHRVFPARVDLAIEVLPVLATSGQSDRAQVLASRMIRKLEGAASQFPNAKHLSDARSQLVEGCKPFYNPELRGRLRLLIVGVGGVLLLVALSLSRFGPPRIHASAWCLVCTAIVVIVAAVVLAPAVVLSETAYVLMLTSVVAVGLIAFGWGMRRGAIG